jgi:hypothetical protein
MTAEILRAFPRFPARTLAPRAMSAHTAVCNDVTQIAFHDIIADFSAFPNRRIAHHA